MREDLHELIDGDLPDEQAAELMHLLSVDPQKRSLFRQQLLLQHDLCRNERFSPLSAAEESEMFERVSRSIGLGIAARPGRTIRRGIAMLGVGFIVGSGVGYFGHGLVGKDSMAAKDTPDTVHVVRIVETPSVQAFDRDSVVAAIRDSLVEAGKATPRKSGVAPRRSSRSTIDDPTGFDAARRLKRNRR
jgi:hypothetical protein